MREIFDRYVEYHIKDRERLDIRDFYAVYRAIEIWHDRTPITFYLYKTCIHRYFMLIYSIIIRTGHIYKMAYDLGALLISPINKAKGYFKIEWRKDWKKYNNSNIYVMVPTEYDPLIGKGALLRWLKELRETHSVKPIEVIDKVPQEDDYS